MTSSTSETHATGTAVGSFKLIQVLPAVTLLLVISLFALEAILQPGQESVPSEDSRIQLERHADAAHGHPDAEASAAPDNPSSQTAQTQSGELPTLGQVQSFRLTERSGAATSQDTLAGKVWIADFIFTSCHMECPLMSAEMQKLQQRFTNQPNLRLVSFSVDPVTDTPEKLRAYATKYGADAARWLFFTGERESLHALAKDSFKLAVEDLSGDKNAASPFMHSQKFVLVDDKMRIRGYYDSNDPASLSTLVEKDVPRLLPGH